MRRVLHFSKDKEDKDMGKAEKKVRAKRKPTFVEAIIPIIAMLLILTIGKGVLG